MRARAAGALAAEVDVGRDIIGHSAASIDRMAETAQR